MEEENGLYWVLENVSLFKELSNKEKDKLGLYLKENKLKRKEFLFKEGISVKNFFIVKTGRLRIWKAIHNKKIIKHILASGKFIGERAALDSISYKKYNDSAIAMENAVVYSIPISLIKEFCKNNWKFNDALIKSELNKHYYLERRLESVLLRKSRDRVLDFIREMAKSMGKPVGHEILIKHHLTHQEIADIIGISRQKVTTILNELKNEKIIYLERNAILIHHKGIL